MLNDCLLESENIQITKKDNKYLLQPTTVKAENTQKFVLKECGKFLKYEKKNFLSFTIFHYFTYQKPQFWIHYIFSLMSGTESEGKRIYDGRKN